MITVHPYHSADGKPFYCIKVDRSTTWSNQPLTAILDLIRTEIHYLHAEQRYYRRALWLDRHACKTTDYTERRAKKPVSTTNQATQQTLFPERCV